MNWLSRDRLAEPLQESKLPGRSVLPLQRPVLLPAGRTEGGAQAGTCSPTSFMCKTQSKCSLRKDKSATTRAKLRAALSFMN